LPIQLVVNNKFVNTVKSETSFLNKKYRGNNHFENLYFATIKESQKNGFQIIWGFTPAVKVWKSKLNFDTVKSNISEATLIFSKYPSNNFLKKYITKKSIKIAKIVLFSILRKLESRNKIHLTKPELIVNSEFPQIITLQEFQEKLSKKFDIKVHLNMNEVYVQWRIKGSPLLKYQYYFFYDKSILVGYIIFSIKDDRLSIADFSFLESETGFHMLAYVVNKHSENITSVFYFGNDDSVYNQNVFEVLKKYNAIVKKSEWANTVIKDISINKEYLNHLDPSGWFINGLWTEGYSI